VRTSVCNSIFKTSSSTKNFLIFIKFLKTLSDFEDMAIGVLDVYDKNTRESVVDVLVIRYLRELGMDCLELANLCECKRFLSNSTVQR
jgi:hypothetical protein